MPSKLSSHRQCRDCGRLLAPVNGRIPPHKLPPKLQFQSRLAAPLPEADAPWCKGTDKLCP